MRPALIFVAVLAFSDGARILGLFPHTGKSHQMVFEPLLRTLAERGHHITVASFFPLARPPANYTDVSFQGLTGFGLETTDLSEFENQSFLFKMPIGKNALSQFPVFKMLAEIALKVCEIAVKWPPLIAALQKDYDLVLVESFSSDCMLGLLDVYGVRAPVVGMSSCVLMPWIASRVGLSDNPAHVPLISLPYTTRMTFAERLENSVSSVFYHYWHKYEIQAKEQAMIEEQVGRKITPLEQLARNISLLLVSSFHPLNGVRPLLPAVVEVGGMHLNPLTKPVPRVSKR